MTNSLFEKIILRQEDLFNEISDSINNKSPKIFTYFSFHCLNEFYENKKYAELVLNDMTFYAADSGIYLLLKILGKKNIENFNGTDFNNSIVQLIVSRHKKFYFIGGNFNQTNLLEIIENLSGYQNGFFEDGQELDIIRKIHESQSDIIIIGMGVPKQEIYAKKIRDSGIDIPIICVGNFMEFYLGTVKRAPEIFRNSGLEWIFRLFTEPKRLWRRYIIVIPKFILRAIKLYLVK